MSGASGAPPATCAVTDPATGEVIARVPLTDAAGVDAAVRRSRAALTGWSRTTPAERSGLLHALAGRLTELAEELAQTESRQGGKPIRLAREFDVPGTIDNAVFFAGAARVLDGVATAEYVPGLSSSTRRDPVGVVGAIAPWNYPLQMAGWKALPALAAGCTVVLKPSELTPLTATALAEAAAHVGFPDGVLQVVTGDGTTGAALAGHPGVDMVTFTGSTATGRRVMALAAARGARVGLELGGKAPFVVLDDADLEAAVHGAVAGALINTGQDCTAATRAIVAEPLFDGFVDGVAALMERVVVGDPRDEATDLGPLVSAAQAAKVAGFVDRARAAGARVVTGGRVPSGLGPGLVPDAYYAPTLLTGVSADAEVVREEVFGPVLAVLPHGGDDEALALANDTDYGLAASVWTRDVVRAARATREVAAGCVWVNDHIPITSEMPHGGMRASGFGKDVSRYAVEEHTVVKHVMTDVTGAARKDWHRTVLRDPGP